MIQRIAFHELAEIELNEAAEFYESQVAGLGKIFLSDIEHAIESIKANPESSPRILKIVRIRTLRRFPFKLLYSILDRTVYILAVAHHKRRPYYWRHRM
jgi:toxin ParE1/3/4